MPDDLLGRTETKGNARSSGYERHQHDWYRESPESVDMLLDVETFEGSTLDPARLAGFSAMAAI
jgi:hypothetical protein